MTRLKIGAALQVMQLPKYRDWLIADQRDLELQDFSMPEILDLDWSGVVRYAQELLDGYSGRLGIHGPYDGLPMASRDPEIRAVVARRMAQGLDVCAALGATQMVVHSPFTTWDFFNFGNKPGARDQVMDLARKTLGPAIARAEGDGVTLVLENIEDAAPIDRLDLARSFDSSAVKVSLDTGHAEYAHGRTGAPPVDYYVRAAGDQLAHVHLQDADGYADRHWALGEGSVRWPAVLRAIAEEAPDARMILELDDPAGIPASMRTLIATGLAE